MAKKMNQAQKGIFFDKNFDSYYIELNLKQGNFDNLLFCHALEKIIAQQSSGVKIVFGFSKRLWSSLTPNNINIQNSTSLQKDTFVLQSTQADLLIWLQGKNFSILFDIINFVNKALKKIMTIHLEQRGFVYHNSQDLTGFIDGTANPKDDERYSVSCIQKGTEGEGGSFAMTQKWIHNLPKFSSLTKDQQEKVIGRTKDENIEFSETQMPKGAHVERIDLKVNKQAIKIYRRSLPFFNSTQEKGLFFLAFTKEIKNFNLLLNRMYGQDGVSDKLLNFSTPVSHSYWFCPSVNVLNKVINNYVKR